VNSFLVQGGISGTGDVIVAGGGFHKWQSSSCLFTGNILVTNVGTLCDINATLSSNVNVHLATGARFGDVNSPVINLLTGTGQVEPGPGLAGNSTLYIGAAGGSGTFDGFFTTNSGGFSCNLSKVGTGTITLTGDQSLSAGNTTVSNGTLIVNNSVGTGLGTGIVTINPTGTLAGTGLVYSASHTLQIAGVLSVGNPGASTGASFTVTNSGIVFNAGGALNVDLFTGAGTGDNTANTAAADVLKAQTATVVIDPTAVLNVGNPNALTGWAIGDKWKVINWNTPPATNFNSFNLPALGVGQAWKTDDLIVDGTISVIAAVAPVSTNADLANLLVTPAGALSPAFDSNTLSYAASEDYSNSPVTVTPTAAETNAIIQVIYAGVTNAVISGSPSGSLSLDANPAVTNVIEVRVTAPDAATVKIYTVKVVRAPSLSTAPITSVVSGNSLTLSWPVDHTGYRLLVQTNNLNNGVSAKTNDWAPVSGASSTNSVTVTIDKAIRNEYYRLTYP